LYPNFVQEAIIVTYASCLSRELLRSRASLAVAIFRREPDVLRPAQRTAIVVFAQQSQCGISPSPYVNDVPTLPALEAIALEEHPAELFLEPGH
jgi:hypothetical protein